MEGVKPQQGGGADREGNLPVIIHQLRKQRPGLGAACGAGPAGRGPLQTPAPPPQIPAWPGSRSNGVWGNRRGGVGSRGTVGSQVWEQTLRQTLGPEGLSRLFSRQTAEGEPLLSMPLALGQQSRESTTQQTWEQRGRRSQNAARSFLALLPAPTVSTSACPLSQRESSSQTPEMELANAQETPQSHLQIL